MIKLSREERTALKTGLSKLKIFLFFVLLTIQIFPQIPFKGFCKSNSFNIEPGYNKLFSFNYDANEYSDLLIYNPLLKKAKLYNGITGTKFTFSKDIDLPVEISDIEPIVPVNGLVESYAFSSRRNRSFGLLKFDEKGEPTITNQIQFNYYPENISIAHDAINNNFNFLISGNSFNGLSIVSINNEKFLEIKITDKTVFKDARFIDLNTDGVEDIAALNSIDNQIHLFFKNSKNKFEELRKISVESDVLALNVFDFNYDGFKDIIVSAVNSITIYFGDHSAGYNKTAIIQTIYSADKFIYGDFNHDGYFDFNYMNHESGYISTIFAKDFEKFYPELVHKKENGFVDVIPFFSKFVYGAAYINENGYVEIISKINSLSEEQNLILSTKPNLLTSFDYLNNGITDFAFTDDEDGQLKFILRDASGLPEKIYSIKLFETHSNLIAFSKSKYIKSFFLYSDNKKMIEVLEVDFENFSFDRKFLYVNGILEDLVIKPDINNDAKLFIIYSKNNQLNLETIVKNELGYTRKTHINLEKNWENPFLVSSNNSSIGYWQKDGSNAILKSVASDNKIYSIKHQIKSIDGNYQLFAKSNQNVNEKENNYCALFISPKDVCLIQGDTTFSIFYSKTENVEFRITNKNQLFFGKNNSIFIADNQSKSLFELIPNKSTGKLRKKKVLTSIQYDNYIIEKLDQRKSNMIFTNSKNGTIEIRQLP